MGYPIEDIEGIGPAYGSKLGEAGIKSTDDFLSLCASKKGRVDVAGKTGLSEKLLLTWANLADLMRISGVGPQYSELLEAAGVDTVPELAMRNAESLAKKMEEVNETRRLSGSAPAASVVESWVAAAKTMDRTVSH